MTSPHSDPAEEEPSAASASPGAAGDDGVAERLRRRTLTSAQVLGGVTALLVVSAWAWPGWASNAFISVLALILIVLCGTASALTFRRAALWRVAGERAHTVDAGDVWVKGGCGTPVPTRQRIQQFRRFVRFEPHILPLRTIQGPLLDGRAVVLHGRRDRLVPDADDEIVVHMVGNKGPFLIRRPADDAVFMADSWILSTW